MQNLKLKKANSGICEAQLTLFSYANFALKIQRFKFTKCNEEKQHQFFQMICFTFNFQFSYYSIFERTHFKISLFFKISCFSLSFQNKLDKFVFIGTSI